ncbi:hypothetical protein [Maribacter litoralis]|uniref:hypothetical protein n=1 Tax=Maribacter litoralis TaxID=2059726 RepID=UPI003F5CE454
MPDIIRTTIGYLAAQKIKIDKNEFAFQCKSHPDYPSLLAVSDTLKFFRINNGALVVNSSEIELLPDAFIAKLKIEKSNPFFLVVKKNKLYTIKNKESNIVKVLSLEELKSIWQDMVFLVENEKQIEDTSSNNAPSYFLNFIFGSLFVYIFYTSHSNIWDLIFMVFPIIGMILSVGAFKFVLNSESEFLSKLCNLTGTSDLSEQNSNSSCNTVIRSSKWKIFEKLNFTDLSITFFSSQIMGLFFMSLYNLQAQYFSIQFSLILLSTPMIIISLYYQKFIIKSWCSICIAIILTLITEMLFLTIFNGFSLLNINFDGLAIYGLIHISILLIWSQIKKLLLAKNDLEKQEITSNRLKRNYSLFRSALTDAKRIKVPYNPICSSNLDDTLNLDILINPYCRYCKEPTKMLEKLIADYGDRIKVSYYHNIDLDTTSISNMQKLVKNLLNLRLTNKHITFSNALIDWFENKDENSWFPKYAKEFDETVVNSILESQRIWCKENKLGLTPTLFINGYQYPNIYEIKDLPYYINELLDDNSLKNDF